MNKKFSTLGIITAATIGGFTLVSALLAILGLSLYRLQVVPANTITVSGIASQDQVNQFAQFNANVSATGQSKEEVNQQMQEIISAVTQVAQDFGIEEKNIKTQYFNIFQEEFTNFEQPDPIVRKGPWRGNTNVSFQKVPGDKAQEFADVLVSSGATSIDGPNFGLDDIEEIESDLVTQAIEDAKTKAESYAQSQGKSLGTIISIDTTGGSGNVFMPLYARGMGGGGGESAFNPGSSEVSTTVTVVFELR